MTRLTVDTLLAMLADGSGEPPVPADEALDAPFPLLGYDSLTVLRTVDRLERTYRIELPETVLRGARTPRELVEQTNAALRDVANGADGP